MPRQKKNKDTEISAPIQEQMEAAIAMAIPVVSEEVKVSEDDCPKFGTIEWSEWLMKQFHAKELVDGNPTCDGLRRLFEDHVGYIISVAMKVVQAPDIQNNGRATVECSIQYMTEDGSVFTISDVADCHKGNTKEPYCKFPTATAATMAESRVYRKTLRLRKVSAEEAQLPSGSEAKAIEMEAEIQDLITDTQKNTIKKISERNGIDLIKLLESLKESVKTQDIDLMTSMEAQAVLRQLNLYSRDVKDGGQVIPENILKS